MSYEYQGRSYTSSHEVYIAILAKTTLEEAMGLYDDYCAKYDHVEGNLRIIAGGDFKRDIFYKFHEYTKTLEELEKAKDDLYKQMEKDFTKYKKEREAKKQEVRDAT